MEVILTTYKPWDDPPSTVTGWGVYPIDLPLNINLQVLAYSVEYLVPFLRRLTSVGILRLGLIFSQHTTQHAHQMAPSQDSSGNWKSFAHGWLKRHLVPLDIKDVRLISHHSKQRKNKLNQVIQSDLFGMVKTWPFSKVKWPPTRG